MKKMFLSLFIISPVNSSYIWAKDYFIHELKAKETLSELVYKKGYKPLYGKDGWVKRVMKLNRVNEISTKHLDPGAIILFPNILKDSVNLAQSSTSSKNRTSGLLYKVSSKQYSLKIATGWSQTSQPLASEKGQAFGISVTLFEHKKFNISMEAGVSLQKSILISHQNNTYARFNPDYNFNIFKNFTINKFGYGPLLSLFENSILSNQDNITQIRRDRNLSLGAYFSYRFQKNFQIKASSKYPLYTQNFNNFSSRRDLESSLSFDTNLLNNFGLSLFTKIFNRQDEDEYSTGLNLTKTFNQENIL